MVPIQIFRRGCHQSSNGDFRCFSDGELSSTARAYNPARYRAPVVIGHPASDGPALGYVKALSYREGFLEAVPGQLEPGFVAKVRAGRYRKVSAAFFSPDHPDNPTPGNAGGQWRPWWCGVVCRYGSTRAAAGSGSQAPGRRRWGYHL